LALVVDPNIAVKPERSSPVIFRLAVTVGKAPGAPVSQSTQGGVTGPRRRLEHI